MESCIYRYASQGRFEKSLSPAPSKSNFSALASGIGGIENAVLFGFANGNRWLKKHLSYSPLQDSIHHRGRESLPMLRPLPPIPAMEWLVSPLSRFNRQAG